MSLPQALAGFNAGAFGPGVEYIGSGIAGNTNGSSFSVDISSAGVQPGDLLIAGYGISQAGDYSSVVPSGFTRITSEYAADTYSTSASVSYQIATFAVTSVSFSVMGTSTTSHAGAVFVFRRAVVPSAWNSSAYDRQNQDRVDFFNLTSSVAPYSMLCAVGAVGHGAGGATSALLTVSSDMDAYKRIVINDTNDVSLAMAVRYRCPAGTKNTGSWYCTGSTTSSSSVGLLVEIPPF